MFGVIGCEIRCS